jgi:signal transduction histidine kinase/CheY-like chemotaxis protein/HPt (histidine-containing phosphotransfer) domain-containing protein
VNRLQNLSIRTKLVLLAAAAVFCALVMSSIGVILKDIAMIRAATIDQLQVQARMVEFNSDAVLAFGDALAGAKLLSSMSLQPAVEAACLIDLDNQVLAEYRKTAATPLDLPTELIPGARVTPDGYIELVTPVAEDSADGEVLGALYIRANTDNIAEHTAALIRYIVFVALGSLLVAMTVTAFLQNAISGPIMRLTEAAQVITREEDYSIRVSYPAQDELGTLYRSFNQMLDALKSTHDQVANQAQQLSQEVGVRKRAESELMIAKDAAEASNRAKSEFLANMSHEIRTPLTGILGFTDVLIAGGDDGDPAKRREYLATIQSSGQHLLGLINDILDLSKIESGRLEFESQACSIDALVGDVVRVLQVKADEKSLDLSVRWETQAPRIVYTDSTRFRQALMNVVGNAIKFTARGGVELVGRCVEADDRTWIEVEVRDTGIGMDAAALGRIFEPFVQADSSVTRRFGGTGLGLAISRRIARGLGGDLTATSEAGRGSRFTLRIDAGDVTGIPLITPAAVERLPAATVSAGSHALPPLDVLLVEDGETNRKLIKLVLTRAGARVTTAENGALGVAAARQQRFDVILMDMQMPVLDGYSAARQLRDDGMDVPIIALTANAMTADREKCLAAGCTDYLSKPINADLLFAAIRRATVADDEPAQTDAAEPATAAARASRPPCASTRTSSPPSASGSPAPASVAAPAPDIASTLPTDDRELAAIVAEYIDALDAKLDEMKAAWDAGDLDELARLAHWLKGSGGTAGFGVLSEPALRLENFAKGKQPGEIPAALAELRTLHGRLIVPHVG